MSESVDILGTGLVSCLGIGVSRVYQAMCAGGCGVRNLTRFDVSPYPQACGGQLAADDEAVVRDMFPEDDFATAMIKVAGAEALDGGERGRNDRLGLILATNFGPVESLEWAWSERLETGELSTDSFEPFEQVTAQVAEFFDCGGPRCQVSMSCASGAAAVCLAKQWIEAGRAERVLVVGYDMLTPFVWTGLTNLRTITTDCMRPFDRDRSGTIFSEGGAAMLLARKGVANSAILGSLAGAAVNNNAFHMTAPPKRAKGSQEVMRAALADAGLAPEAVEHVCAHATSTSANDSTEAAALRDLFGERLDRMTVAAHKSQLGHMMGGAGVAEAAVTVEAMSNGVIPPTVNHENPDPECVLDCIPGEARKRQFSTAITNSAGIGGNNGSLVLRGRQ